ncbi:MAG: translocation/assembly module TamB domain-containing protein [Chlorobiales bacterium]|nr:translocation/assembly module TamB domain-containing protein [Chlorobiales bacterium]
MTRLKNYILRLLVASSVFVLLLSLTSLIILNSGVLDSMAKDEAIALFNKKLFGRLELQELHLQFPNKVTLINPRIYGPDDKTPALQARTVSLKFNFLTLLQPQIKRIYLRRLTADSLSAKLTTEKNGKLNLELIFKSRDPDSTKAKLEHFFCKNLQLKNSSLSYSANPNNSGIPPLSVHNINLGLYEFTVRKKLVKGRLDKLQLNIPQERFTLRQASGQFHFSEAHSELLDFKAVSNKSSAELSATIDHFNIFARRLRTQLALSTSFLNVQKLALHSDDLKILFPAVTLPAGVYTLKGNAKGKRDNFEILDASLTHLKSKIAIKGELLNTANSNLLAYKLKCDSSKIAAPFIESLLKESAYKNLASKTGTITFLGHAEGSLKAVKTDIKTLSNLGEASLSMKASKVSEQLTAKGTFTLKGFKPHKLLEQDSDLKSLINATGSFDGNTKGAKVNQLTLDMKLADSYWRNQTVKVGTLAFKYNSALLKTSLSLKNELSSFNLDGDINWSDKTPLYHAAGKTTGLDISKILRSNGIKTNLNGAFAIQGSGYEPKNLNVAAVMQFSPSTIDGFQLKDHSKASLEIAQTTTSSRASITSDFLDVLADGDYSLEELIALGKLAGSGIAREIAAQNIWRTSIPTPVTTSSALKKPFTVNYRITARDISPLAMLFPIQGLNLQGSADGRALYRNGQCSISSSINLARLQSHNDLLIENLSMKAEVECNSNGAQKASVSGKTSAVTVARKKTGTAIFSGMYEPSRLDGTIDLVLPNPAQNFSTKFSVAKDGNTYNLLFDHLLITDTSGIWKAAEKSHVMLDRTTVKFNHFTIAKGVQQIVMDGELSNSQPGSFQGTLSNVELKELSRLSIISSLDKLSGTINASLAVSGNPNSKTTTLQVNGKGIRYDKFSIGTLKCDAHHIGNQLRFEVHSNAPAQSKIANQSTASINTIEGSGTLPLVLSFYPLQFRMADQQAISASFHSDNLSAEGLTYVLPFLESAEGIIPTTLKIEGRTPQPDIYLTTRLRDTKIKIEATQVSYRLNGEVYVTPNAIELRNISVNDNHKGNGRISGVVKLEKLQPTGLDIGARFESLLLFDKKDKKDETSFGTITGTTNSIRLHGTLTSPITEGELRINAADYSLYRAGANENAKYVGINKFIEFVPRYPVHGKTGIDEEKSSKPIEFYHSVIDILEIKNLRLSSVEPLKYTVIFDRIRGEQLETSINNLSLLVSKSNQQYRLFGSVNVIGGKYKFSNTNFDLQDGGRISWNNVDIRSGVMDNLYGNKYVSASNQQTSERDNVKLLIAITGTLNEPLVTMGYYLNEQTQPYASSNMIGGKSSQIDPNAELNVISMLLSKQWYARPGSTAQASSIAVSSVGISAGSGLLSSQFSKVIQDVAGLESFNVNVGVDKRGALSGLDLYFALSVPGTDGKVRFIGSGSAPTLKDSPLSNYYGTEQKIEYRISPKVFIETYRSYGLNENGTSSTNLQAPSEIWGASISYRERFQTWDQFWKRLIPSSDKKK